MLELRPCCENCGLQLPPNSDQAYICSFECTFCKDCVTGILENVCPNCTGGLVPRPMRPKGKLAISPASVKRVVRPVDIAKQEELKNKYASVDPSLR
jgi:hypothetical protein